MTKIEISDRYWLFFRIQKGGVFVELHDFHNLEMYRELVSNEEFNDMKRNPGKYV